MTLLTSPLRQAALLLLAATTLSAGAAAGIEEVLTPAQYFDCQIAARQATIVGLQERAAMPADAAEADKLAAGDRSRERVRMAMYACGRQDAATLGAYAHRNAELLQTWLNANPQVKAQLDAQAKQVEAISAQMPAVAPSAQR